MLRMFCLEVSPFLILVLNCLSATKVTLTVFVHAVSVQTVDYTCPQSPKHDMHELMRTTMCRTPQRFRRGQMSKGISEL